MRQHFFDARLITDSLPHLDLWMSGVGGSGRVGGWGGAGSLSLPDPSPPRDERGVLFYFIYQERRVCLAVAPWLSFVHMNDKSRINGVSLPLGEGASRGQIITKLVRVQTHWGK